MDPTTLGLILAALPFAYDVTKDITKYVKGRIDTRRNAIDTLSLAVRTTDAYMEHLQDGGERNGNMEVQLEMLWNAAADAITPIADDPEIPSRLRVKSSYWRDPSKWSDEDVEKARIGLSQIRQELRRWIRTVNNEGADNTPSAG